MARSTGNGRASASRGGAVDARAAAYSALVLALVAGAGLLAKGRPPQEPLRTPAQVPVAPAADASAARSQARQGFAGSDVDDPTEVLRQNVPQGS